MADVKFERVTLTVPQGSSVNTVFTPTIAGFGTPKAVMYSCVTQGSVRSSTSIGFFGPGTQGASTQHCMGSSTNSGLATSQTAKMLFTTDSLSVPDNNGNADVRFRSQNFIEDGVNLQLILGVPSEDKVIEVLFIGGTDVADVYIEFISWINDTRITPGFEPSLVLTASVNRTPSSGQWAENQWSVGVAVNDGLETQRCLAQHDKNAVAVTESSNYLSSNFSASVGTSGIVSELQLTAFTATGYSYTTTGTGTTTNVTMTMCIRLTGDAVVSVFDVAIPDTGDYVETGAGFTPFYGLIATGQGAVLDSLQNTNVTGFGLISFDPNGMQSQTVTTLDGESSNSIAQSQSVDGSLALLDKDYRNGNYVVGGAPTFTASGWTFPLTVNPTVPLLGWGLAIGPGAAAGVTFDGPNIVPQTGTENVLYTFDENAEGTVASRFTGATTYALAPGSDALPTGLTVNATTGNIEGTPTEVATRNITIRGSE